MSAEMTDPPAELRTMLVPRDALSSSAGDSQAAGVVRRGSERACARLDGERR